MSLNALIIQTLTPLGVPVGFHTLTAQEKASDPDTYIIFREYNQNGALHADDKEIISEHFIQVDIWSKVNYLSLAKQVKDRLIEIGFIRTMETEMYDSELELYQKVFRFSITQ